MDVKVNVDNKLVEEAVKDQIRAAVVSVLSKDPGRFIANIVDAALNQKKDSWSRETYFQAEVNNMIRAAAIEAFRSELEAYRDPIKAAIKKRMSLTPEKLADKVATALIAGLENSMIVEVKFPFEH